MKGPSASNMDGATNGRTTDGNMMSDREPTEFLLNNRDFFKGFKFNFEGFDPEIEKDFIMAVKDLGADVCDDAEYILVHESYPQFVKGPKRQKLYHIIYILDSLEAKKPLDISKYSFFKYAYHLFSTSNKVAPTERRKEINGNTSNQIADSIDGQQIKSEGEDVNEESQNGSLKNLNSTDAEFFDNMNEDRERMRAAGKLEELSVDKKSKILSGEESDIDNDSYSLDSGTYRDKTEALFDEKTFEKKEHLRVKSVDSINYGCSDKQSKYQDKIIEESLTDSSDDLADLKQSENHSTPKNRQMSETVQPRLTERKTQGCKIRKRVDSNSSSSGNEAASVKRTHLRRKRLRTSKTVNNPAQPCTSKVDAIIISSSASDEDQEWLNKNVGDDPKLKRNPFNNGKNSENSHPGTSKEKKDTVTGENSDESHNELSMSSSSDDDKEEEKEATRKPFTSIAQARNRWWEATQTVTDPCQNPSCKLEPQPHQFHSDPERVMSLLERRILIKYFILTNQIVNAKGVKVYQTIHEDGYLKNRSSEALRNNFRRTILPNIEEYGLPKKIEKEFIALRSKTNASY